MRTMLLGFVLSCAACTHSVTVFVPTRDVPPRTYVVGAIKPGRVLDFEAGTRVFANGVVARNGNVVANLDADDLVVIEGEVGESFGRTHVRRADASYALMIFGGILLFGGPIVSWVAAAACGANEQSKWFSGLDCALGALVGTGASIVFGAPVLAAGFRGPLRVDIDGTKVSITPGGFVARF